MVAFTSKRGSLMATPVEMSENEALALADLLKSLAQEEPL